MTIFLCGTPASGKSTFGEYLRDHLHYFFIDMEHKWPDEKLHKVWDTIFSSGFDARRIYDFVSAIGSIKTNSILDLGFPLYNDNYFKIIPKLKEFGFRIIWFDCDREIARQRFLNRLNSPSIEDFDIQMSNIENNWNKIITLINPEIINVLNPNKSGKTAEEIYREIFPI